VGVWGLLAGLAIVAVVGWVVGIVRADRAAGAGMRAALRRPVTWLVGGPALLLIMLVGAPFVYLQSVTTTPPKPLSFADLITPSVSGATTSIVAAAETATSAGGGTTPVGGPTATADRAGPGPAVAKGAVASPIAGAWAIGHGTQARYHVDDNVMGQTSEVVGSTPDVTGTMTIVNSTVATTRVVVNMQTVTCNCVHDSKYHDMLDTDVYPTSTFELTHPLVLAAIPAEGEVINVGVTGNFTIHGVTREVSFTLAAVRQAGRVAVNGRIPVKLADYNIDSPDGGPFGGLSNALIEFLVAFDRTG
jgi:polyisoprenoid-binding protein YceI